MPWVGRSAAERAERIFQTSLLLLVANGFAAVLSTGRLDVFSTLVMSAGLGWRLLQVLGVLEVRFPERWASLLGFAYAGFCGLDVLYLSESAVDSFIPATLRVLFFVTALKLAASRTNRDYFYLGLLAFLQLLTASMFLVNFVYLVMLLLFFGLSITTFAAFEIRRGAASGAKVVEDRMVLRRRQLGWQLAFVCAALAVSTVAVSFGLFLVVPRMPGKSMLPGLRGDFSVGFAKEVDLGTTGFLQPNYAPVMEIESLSGDQLDGLRWRGLALRHFDGVRWSNPAPQEYPVRGGRDRFALSGKWYRSESGRRVLYRVALKPLPVKALFLAGLPERIILKSVQGLRVTKDDAFLTQQTDTEALSYEVQSWLQERRSAKPANVVELFSRRFSNDYLQLPELDPRIAELAVKLTEGAQNPLARADSIERYLRTELGYTLDLPQKRHQAPLAHFLFERRQGHCEYFATAMTMMLRTVGIPARLVSGFAGGVYNPISEVQVLRSSDAHTWVEAYLPGYGWMSFDPTPPAPEGLADRWLAQYWLYWHTLQSAWSEWVVDYDETRQRALAETFQEGSRQTAWSLAEWFGRARQGAAAALRRAAVILEPIASQIRRAPWTGVALLALSLATILVLVLWLSPRLLVAYRSWRLAAGAGSSSDCIYLYRRALGELEKRGYAHQPWQTAEEHAASILQPEIRHLVEQIARTYSAARFGQDREAERHLPALVQALQRA